MTMRVLEMVFPIEEYPIPTINTLPHYKDPLLHYKTHQHIIKSPKDAVLFAHRPPEQLSSHPLRKA